MSSILRVGTSGFSYDEWKPSFYPEKTKKKDMLSYYGGQLSAVELNNTFYRMPKTVMCESWRESVGEDFRFAVKASRRFTQSLKLRECEELLGYLYQSLGALGETLGCVFVQVPKFLKKDPMVLREFLAANPEGARLAFEFMDPGWLDDEVFDVMREFDAALVHSDRDDAEPDDFVDHVGTGTWGYLRLRREGYDDEALQVWRDRIEAAGWQDCFVFFKHEDSCAGPALAKRFLEQAAGR